MKPAKNSPQTVPQPAEPEHQPPLPHERDQTTRQQAAPIQPEIAQAHRDLATGKQDTDLRGEASRKAIAKSAPRDHTPPQTGEEDPLASIADVPARSAAGKAR
ncbi:hypothetical protein [Uliginosibacterium sp. H1]|uniref:hypothetical protein n=1 Tax=Uliginosibacterium sp. H1 TaxID=3114757 RepID=UPI002E193E53|nr:hypothetical protein [Uliginosibacterium sp. H1]